MALAMQIGSGRKLVSPYRIAAFSFLSLLGAADFLWAKSSHINFTGFELSIYGITFLLAVSVIYGKFRVDRRLSEAAYYVALWCMFTAVAAPFTYLAATLGFPLYDNAFVKLDRFLGFDWEAYYGLFAKSEFLYRALMSAYASFVPQILFAIIFFSHTQQHDRNDELFWSAAVSLVLTGVASGIWPAAGALYHFGIGLDHAVHLNDYFALRNGDLTHYALRKMEGIIAFPSYHTVIAILMVYVYRKSKLFWLVLGLNALMLLSIPIFGGHYLVDMLGGAAIAVTSIHATKFVRSCLCEDSDIA